MSTSVTAQPTTWPTRLLRARGDFGRRAKRASLALTLGCRGKLWCVAWNRQAGGMGMDVSEAVARRVSIRAFRPDPVPGEAVAEILVRAAQAPSGGNLQPWRVYGLSGAPLAAFRALVAANPFGE